MITMEAKIYLLYFFSAIFGVAALYYTVVNIFTAFVWGFATYQLLLFTKVYKYVNNNNNEESSNEPWFLSSKMMQYYYPIEIVFYTVLIVAFSIAGIVNVQLFWDNSSYFMTAIASFIALKWCILVSCFLFPCLVLIKYIFLTQSYRMSRTYLTDKDKMNQTPLISSIGEIA